MKEPAIDHESILSSIGATSELDEFMPYLLQDLWALGSFPEKLVELIHRTNLNLNKINVLDLGCGKGAAAISIAKQYGCTVSGVDGYLPFINEAKTKAREYNIEHLVSFTHDDIKNFIVDCSIFDIVILSSVGSVWGKWSDTILHIDPHIKNNGYLIIDEGFITEGTNENYLTHAEVINEINKSSLRIVEEIIHPPEMLIEENKKNNQFICKRAEELILKYPEKKNIIEEYVNNQFQECEFLENHFRSASWLLKK